MTSWSCQRSPGSSSRCDVAPERGRHIGSGGDDPPSPATDAIASYVQQAAASSPASAADQLAKLADLRDRGVISAEDFEREKAKVLAA